MARVRPPSEPATGASLFAALGDETRLALVASLAARGPLSITRLTEGGGVTRQAVTKHLEVLAAVGLVSDAVQGRERIWQMEPHRLQDAQRSLDLISRQWDDALDRLRAHVESDADS